MAASVGRRVFRFFLFCTFSVAAVAATQHPAGDHAGDAGEAPRGGVNGVSLPKCISCPQPEYTRQARKVNFNGTVLLDTTVSAEGKIVSAVLLLGPGMGLNEKALAQVKKWKMKPALGQDGKPTACRIQIQVTFRKYNESAKHAE
jgi:protein TonB